MEPVYFLDYNQFSKILDFGIAKLIGRILEFLPAILFKV